MTNLIFDLNNIAHRSIFIVGGYGSKQYDFNSQIEIDQLMRKMATDISYIIRIINPSRIIFAQDDSSWRKDIKIEENEGYKATRTKSTNINWDNVYHAINEFTEILQNNGMIVTKIPKAEADDIITLWNNELTMNHRQHVVIVSGDEDLRQLVCCRHTGSNDDKYKYIFTTVFNPFMQGKNASRKFFVPEKFEEWINTPTAVDFMNMKETINIDKEDFYQIITNENTKMESISGRIIALRKLFCGDDGDNVPAIYTWLNEKGVEVRITNSKFEKIYEQICLSPNEILDHIDILNRSEEVMNSLKKVSKQTQIPFEIHDRLERQVKLVVLDQNFFPKEIVEKFKEIKQAELNKPRINYGSINMQDLLTGTRYVSENNHNEAPIFKEIDRIKGLF